jgi:coenzyme F420-0:L-glutamate ligase / coenzyme F420-1:gamma-L-glutamate ligase
MSSVLDAIRKRRSIRKYSNQPVAEDAVLEVLEAARWAPSAHNAQPWRFIVLKDASVKRKLASAMAEVLAEDMVKDKITHEVGDREVSVSRFSDAPVVVVACLVMADMKRFSDKRRQKSERDLAVQSIGASIQNMLLAASAKGLGACWYCAPVFCKKVVREVLAIPKGIEPQALITLGYSDDKISMPQRKQLYDFCSLNCWSKSI